MKNKLISFVFILLIVASFVVLALPADTESFKKENRERATLPTISKATLKDGSFMMDFESYINDSVGFRSYFTDFSDMLKKRLGVTPPEGRVVYTNKDIGTKTVNKACLLLLEDKVMEVFSSNRKNELLYANALNTYAQNLASDINLYSMLVPTQLQFQMSVYKNIQSDQKEAIDYVYKNLDSRIKSVDVYSNIESHMHEYVYFRTDHHWTMLGAYYGYEAFAKAAGVEPKKLEEFTKYTADEGFLGYLYNQVNEQSLKEHKDYIEWYNVDEMYDLRYSFMSVDKNDNYTPYSAKMFDRTATDYRFFFVSDHPYVKIHNNSLTNGKSVLVIKDSYANAFAPWLVNNFENVIMVDPRFFEGSIQNLIKRDSITDVVVVNYIFTTVFADYCEALTNIAG